jgi:hypothetical protein
MSESKNIVWYHAGRDAIKVTYQNPCGCCPESLDYEIVPLGKVRPKRYSLMGRASWFYQLWSTMGWEIVGDL